MEWRLPPILDLEKSCADVRKGDGAPTPPAIAPLLRDSQPTSSLYVVDFSVDGGQLFFGDVVCFLFLFEVICNKVSLEKCDILHRKRILGQGVRHQTWYVLLSPIERIPRRGFWPFIVLLSYSILLPRGCNGQRVEYSRNFNISYGHTFNIQKP